MFYPALPSDPGHALWKRDFSGASGLVSLALADGLGASSAEFFVDSLQYFGIGASWGGYESLVQIASPDRLREHSVWTGTQPVVRLHVGLEDKDDLIADLQQAFDKTVAAAEGLKRSQQHRKAA